MSRTGIHFADPENSPRLTSALSALYYAGKNGLTSLELQEKAKLVAPGTCVSELRAAGWEVSCSYDGKSPGGRKIYRYTLLGRKGRQTA